MSVISLTCSCSFRNSSRQEVFSKKGVLKNSCKFAGKHLHRSLLFLIKLQAEDEACNFIKGTLMQI